ncbi:S41 family peptidase, partial [Mycobacterium tuberculosis]|uniref:S41 family peptidase n=1 Tax=Mycobacterium tuberculosis TaxID=1773 RepID=UPI0004F29906
DTLDESIGKMRGTPGSKVTLTLLRPGHDKPIVVALVREKVVQRPVKWSVKDGVGLITITAFSEHTGDAVTAAIRGIVKQLGHDPLGY